MLAAYDDIMREAKAGRTRNDRHFKISFRRAYTYDHQENSFDKGAKKTKFLDFNKPSNKCYENTLTKSLYISYYI